MNHPNFTTIGHSDVSNIKRVKYSMEVSSCVLYSKLTEAVKAMGSTKLSYEWLSDQAKVSQSSFSWKMILDFQMKFHVFVH